MRSAFEPLRGFFHGYDYSAALDQWHSVCDFVSGKALAAGGLPTKEPTVSALSLREQAWTQHGWTSSDTALLHATGAPVNHFGMKDRFLLEAGLDQREPWGHFIA